MKVLAIDPDTHHTGIAVADEARVYLCYSLQIPKELTGRDAVVEMCKALWCAMGPLVAQAGGGIEKVVVEGQRVYKDSGQTKNPQSIVMLSQVAGAALTAAMTYAVQPNALLPYPQEWKGETSKPVSQLRAYAHYGMGGKRVAGKDGGYAVPDAGDHWGFPAGQWKHVGDALALAEWAATLHCTNVARVERITDPELNALLGRKGVDREQAVTTVKRRRSPQLSGAGQHRRRPASR